MATQKKYLSYDKLVKYDEKLKAKMAADDAAVLAQSKEYAEGLAGNYDAAGSAATAEENAKKYADAQIAEKADAKGSAAAVDAKLATEVSRAKEAEAANKALAEAAQADVDALEEYVGVFTSDDENVKTVIQYIDKKTSGIATDAKVDALGQRVTQAEADIDALEGLVGTETVAKQIEDAVKVETDRATGVESGLESRLATVEGDYLKAADKEALQSEIDKVNSAVEVLTDGVDAEKVDGVKDLIQYVEDHGAEVTGMKSNIDANAEAITAEAERATGVEAGLQTAVEKAQADATKANTELAAEIQRATGVEAGLEGRLANVEGQLGESGSVAEDIEAAKNAAIAAASQDATTKANAAKEAAITHANTEVGKVQAEVDALEAVVGTKASQDDLTALTGRVTTVEGKVSTLETEMDAVEALAAANKLAHEANAAAIALKASQADLNSAVARIAANEAEIASFIEISDEDINGLFTV